MTTQHGERTFRVTEFGIQAVDRGIANGVQEAVLREIMEEGPVTSSDVIHQFPQLPPDMLKRQVDDMISKNWLFAEE